MSENNNRGRIRKPIAPEVVKYVNDPVAKSDYETSYFTYLTINRAHVLMLEKQGIISKETCQAILKATREIEANPIAPDFKKDSGIEDLYTTLERRLIKMVGLEIGGQQHTARSRNDLGATVLRMDTRDYYLTLCELFLKLRETLLKVARENYDAVFSGYTHMQPSEPVTLAHYLSAVLNGLERDYRRLQNAWEGLNICPLGGGSMGGDGSTGYVVFVKADQAPDNAILEPDPTWGCPEGFWTVPVEVGLSSYTKIYENMTVGIEAAYMALWLDKSSSVWGNSRMNGYRDDVRDAWNINFFYAYNF